MNRTSNTAFDDQDNAHPPRQEARGVSAGGGPIHRRTANIERARALVCAGLLSVGLTLAASAFGQDGNPSDELRVCRTDAAMYVSDLGGAVAASDGSRGWECTNRQLRGRYVFTATGFTRPPASPPGTPWVPKAILEVLQFNGDGTLGTPAVTVANPFGDSGAILQPPMGAPGEYTVNPDCTGSVHFFDQGGVTFSIFVESFGGTIRMIQTNPANNVFEGKANRSW